MIDAVFEVRVSFIPPAGLRWKWLGRMLARAVPGARVIRPRGEPEFPYVTVNMPARFVDAVACERRFGDILRDADCDVVK